ncbi:MAG: sirohydrochlorin cobaltochelatase, partial [Vallitaleaceae bacterium]|nr:sirohydrochlorin cobaltochelatase [Vallitaleaceae bacterium]
MINNIGIVIMSHGSAQLEATEKALGLVEKRVTEIYPKAFIFRAFSSERIRSVLRKKGCIIFSPKEAVEELIQKGSTQILIQSLHIIPGLEYEQVEEEMHLLQEQFPNIKIRITNTLLHGEKEVQEFTRILPAIVAPYQKEQIILLGHGTEHAAGAVYGDLEQYIQEVYSKRIWVSTLEEGVENFLQRSNLNKQQGKVVIIPLLWVSANHVRKDIVEKDGSWQK